jgi:hypothetical protein
MAKLHELLAVESDLEGTYNRILKETGTNFLKHPDRYFGKHQRVESFDENAPKESDVHKEMDDTINGKLKYSQKSVVRYLDAVLQKERTNQEARSDLVVDGTIIAKDVPATFLLGLETKLKKVRTHLYETIPTLQPGVKWEKDSSFGDDVYRMVNSEEKFRTKKVMKNHVISPATDKHPAQVNVYNEDEKVARVIIDTWCGMISSAEKSQKLNKVDKLIRAVKKARQKANTTEVVNMTIGKELFDFIEE